MTEKHNIYISHATLFVFDSFGKLPANAWTSAHWEQLFARRPSSMNIVALVEEDGFIVEVDRSSSSLMNCERVVGFSLLSESGRIILDGGESGTGVTVWEGRPGWVRVTVGQALLKKEEPQWMRVVVVAEEAVREELTTVREKGTLKTGPFLEIADPA
jgi:hypothetical protein